MERFSDRELTLLETKLEVGASSISGVVDFSRFMALPEQTEFPRVLPASRLAILADDSNLYHSARSVGTEFSYERLFERLESLPVAKALIFRVEPDFLPSRNNGTNRKLTALGYQVFTKTLHVNGTGKKKGNIDIELACQAFSLVGKVDAIILVTGDGDFAPLVRLLRSQSVAVHVLGFRFSTSLSLIQEADSFLLIGKDLLTAGGNGGH